jgi:hypothetical protein
MKSEMIVAVLGVATAIITLLAAILGRKRHITAREEHVHRQEMVHIEKRAEPEYVARCHDCGRGIRDGEVSRRNVRVGNSRQWKRGFLGIGGRWEVINQYATVDLCPKCVGTRSCATAVVVVLVLIGGVLFLGVMLANQK